MRMRTISQNEVGSADATPLRPSRWRALILLLALVVLIVAQSYLDARRLPAREGKVLFAVGLILAAASVLPQRKNILSLWSPPSSFDDIKAIVCHPNIRVVLLLATMLAAVTAVYAGQQPPHRDAPIVFLTALFLPLASFVIQGRWWQTFLQLWHSEDYQRVHILEIGAFFLILALAIWLRTVNLANIPPYINVDEALDGVEAKYLRDGTYQNLFQTVYADQTRLSFALAAVFLALPGDPVLLLRLSSVVCGLLTLPFLYLMARMFLGRAFALITIFLLAVTALDINYSRMGILNIQAAPLLTTSVYFLLRTIRDHRLGDVIACGILGGLAVYSYFPSRPIPFIVGVVLFCMLLRYRRNWSRYIVLGGVMLAVAVFIAAPQLAFYVTHPQMLIGHSSWHLWFLPQRGTIPAIPDLIATLSRQLDGTFWGFNYHYDNSFHFTPNTKLLDTVTAILFFIGFIVSLRRVWQPAYLVLVAWIVVSMIMVGVLARNSPSSVRLCGVIPAVCLTAAVGLHRIWELWRQQGIWAGRMANIGAFVLVPLTVFVANYHVYFTRVANAYTYDYPTEAARYLERNKGNVTAFIVGATLDPNHSPIKFLVPDVPTYVMFSWEEYLPIRQAIVGDAVFIFNEAQAPAMNIVREYYPDGILEELRRPDGRLVMAIYRVSGEDAAAYQGLVGSYRSLDGSEVTVNRRDLNIAFDWAKDKPASIAQDFAVTWDGSLFVPAVGNYRLRVEGMGRIELTLDNTRVLPKDAVTTAADAIISLTKGWHRLHINYQGSGGSLQLMWMSPNAQRFEVITPEHFSVDAESRGLLAAYYSGQEIAGQPVLQAIEPALFNRYSNYSRRFGWQPYVATWTGCLHAPTTGTYRIAVRAFEGTFTLKLDGNTVLAIEKSSTERIEKEITLTQGCHRIDMLFRSPTGRTEHLELWWAPPGQTDLVPIPPSALSP